MIFVNFMVFISIILGYYRDNWGEILKYGMKIYYAILYLRHFKPFLYENQKFLKKIKLVSVLRIKFVFTE